MFKKTKKSLALFIALILAMALCVQPMYATTAIAEEGSTIQPRWDHARMINLVINTTSPMSIRITATGTAGTTYKNGVAVLTKVSGSGCGVVGTWSGISSDSAVLQYSATAGYPSSGTYRLTLTITTVNNGASETVSTYSEVTY